MTNPQQRSLFTLDFQFDKIRKDKDGRYSLNDMHRMAGGHPNQRPGEWVRLDSTASLLEVIQFQHSHTAGKNRSMKVLTTKEGKGGGTWAIQSLSLAYAKYLSPEFHAACLKIIEERIEEVANPELGIKRAQDRAVEVWDKRGKHKEWISARLDGINTRRVFTSACAQRGVKDFRLVTNGIYTGLFGKTARELREQKHLPEGANVRDAMNETELIATRLAENLAVRRAEDQRLWGDGEMATAANHCGRSVQDAVASALNKKTA